MKTFRSRHIGLLLIVLLTVVAITALTTGSLGPPNQHFDSSNQKFTLTRPTFMQSARASMPPDIATMLDQEAGISAWIDAGSAIDLTNAANAFVIIENQTSEYIIGSVDLPNYAEHYDAHVYVHSDGYILAYYLRQDPAAKIIQIKELNITSTHLASIVSIVASAGGVPASDIKHYDFRYPNASHILMVYENEQDGDNFTINMPTSFVYHERGYACYASNIDFILNGVNLPFIYGDASHYGTITAAQLPPGVTHSISVDDYGVLIITYTEP